MPANEPRGQHYVAQGYLRQFANEAERICAHRRDGTKILHEVGIGNIAVVNHLYTLEKSPTGDKYLAEHAYEKIEDAFCRAVANLAAERLPISEADRAAVSVMIGFQLTRSPHARMEFQQFGMFALQQFFEDKEVIKGTRGIPTKHLPKFTKDSLIAMSVQAGADIIDDFLNMRWAVGKMRAPAFLTSDHPVGLFARVPPSKIPTLGVRTAEEIYLPLDRTHVLIMRPRGSEPAHAQFLPPQYVEQINRVVALWSYGWIFEHPEDDIVRACTPRTPRPVLQLPSVPS